MAAPPSLRVTAPSHSSTSMDDYSDISDFSTPEDTLSSIPEELQLKAGNKAIVVQVRKIGKGGHARVWKAAMEGGDVALKELKHSDVHSARELEVAALFRSNPHKNIITSYEPMESAEASYLPLELACSEVPDAFSAVESYGPMSEPSAQVLFGQVVTALRHSYSMGIYHGDVKPENILLCHCGEGGHACGLVKLADFGSAQIGSPMSTRPSATLLYGSPETIPSSSGPLPEYDIRKHDVWALAVSITASVSGFMPWEAAHPSDRRYSYWTTAVTQATAPGGGGAHAMMATLRSLLFPEGTFVSRELLHLLAGMLQPDPAARFGIDDVAVHPWMTNAPKHAMCMK